MLITKRNGNLCMYDDSKVISSILKANGRAPGENISMALATAIADEVFTTLTEESEIITTKEIREAVFKNLCDRGFRITAQEYIEYKKD